MSYAQAAVWPPAPLTTRGQFSRLSCHDGRLVYTNGRGVYLRSLSDPSKTIAYFGHSRPATAARVSPSGFYVASGDSFGTIRIWDIAGTDRVLKLEQKVLRGAIRDIAWDSESKRIIAVGEGTTTFGSAFAIDTGASCGTIIGHTMQANAAIIRPIRPYRAATASDDGTIVFYHGVPFKTQATLKSHQPGCFIQALSYAPSGSVFASAASDRNIFIYDGATGDVQGSLSDPALSSNAHKGGIYAVEFNKDSTRLISCSSDATVKLWDVSSRTLLHTWSITQDPAKPPVSDHQLGVTWTSDNSVISISLSGTLNQIDTSKPEDPVRYIYGHQKSTTAFCASTSTSKIYCGTFDGSMSILDYDGNETPINGTGPSNQINQIITPYSDNAEKAYLIAMDDTLREINLKSQEYTQLTTSTPGLPKGMCTLSDADGTCFAYTMENKIVGVRNGKQLLSHPVSYTPTAITATSRTTSQIPVLAVGAEDGITRLYDIVIDNSSSSISLKEQSTKLQKGQSPISCISFAPPTSEKTPLLAIGNSIGRIFCYDLNKTENVGKPVIENWILHSARIHDIAWTSDAKHAASASMDTNVFIWSVERPISNIVIRNAHAGGASGVQWLDKTTLVSSGADGVIYKYNITHHK